MSASGISPEHIASSPHPIDAYYDHIFEHGIGEGSYFPYDEGQGLEATVGIDYVSLADPDISEYKFAMSRVQYWGQSVLVFSVCNVIDGQRHPLLYPARIIERAVPLLEDSGRVDAVKGYWLAPPSTSDNYREYIAGLHRIAPGRAPTEAEQAIAARGTWTGQQLARLGYSAVQDVHVNDYGNVEAFFTRPS